MEFPALRTWISIGVRAMAFTPSFAETAPGGFFHHGLGGEVLAPGHDFKGRMASRTRNTVVLNGLFFEGKGAKGMSIFLV